MTPLRGKCRRCHQAGHFVRDCPKPVWYVPGREDKPSSASSVAPPSGEGSTPVGENITVVTDEDGEVPLSQASQSVLSVGVDPAPVVEDALASSQAPSETSGGKWIWTHWNSRTMSWMRLLVNLYLCLVCPFLGVLLRVLQGGHPLVSVWSLLKRLHALSKI